MTQEEMSTLRPGDKVKIVDIWVDGCNQAPDGAMDKFLGQVVTVRDVFTHFNFIHILEDDNSWGGWNWFPESIECVVERHYDIENNNYKEWLDKSSVLDLL